MPRFVLPAAITLAGGLSGPALAQLAEPDISIRYRLNPEGPGQGFGFVAEVIGDLDGDGAPDFVVGAPFHPGGGPVSGRATVFSGADGSRLTTITGFGGLRLGFAVAGVGDATGDGVPDYAVGGPGVIGGPAGRVFLLDGATHEFAWQAIGQRDAFFGFDLGRAGDVNGDGRADVVVGANRDSRLVPNGGSVTVLSGVDGSVIWTRFGTLPFGNYGAGVSGVADVDGDGLPEQAVSSAAAGSHGQGAAYVLRGANGEVLRELTPNGTGSAFGFFFVHDAGDVDADGDSDVFVGDTGDGRAYVYDAATGERVRSLHGGPAFDGYGIGRGAGDLDGDGHADLVIGAWVDSSAAPQGGKVYLVSGKTGRTLRTFTGTEPLAQLGFDAVALGDVSGDGVVDVLITGANIAYVVHGIAP